MNSIPVHVGKNWCISFAYIKNIDEICIQVEHDVPLFNVLILLSCCVSVVYTAF